MVSTRQMSTAVSSNNNNSNDEMQLPPQPPNTRMSVITRQSSSNASCTAVASSSRGISSPTTSNHQRGGGGSGVGSNSNNSSSSNNNNSNNTDQNAQRIFLLDLPIEILDKIFSYVGYKKVGQMRVISRQMNQVCSSILNSTFSKLQTQMLHRFQTVKAMMPRRESARRNHPLACECDIIETCYMRLSLLQMTFGKHIERKHCCFFPGGILDEVYYVLNYIRTTPKLERPYKVTDELFDLSTMAMEYFKEHIEPNLPEIVYFSKDFFDISSKSKQTYSIKAAAELTDTSSSPPPQSNMVLRKGIRKIKQGMKMYNNQLTALRSELRTCKRKSSEQGKQIAEQQKLLADQQKQTLEYASRLDENDRKNEEISRKFSTLLQELNKCKTELQYWRSKSPAVQVCTSCGHKITPTVAPEEYQALLNQGVKPQDININLDDVDDSDTSSNIFSDFGLDNQSTSEFVFPDEATTAKLLAVSSAATAAASTAATAATTNTTTTITIFGNNNGNGGGGGNAVITGSKRRYDGTLRATATATTTSISNSDNNKATFLNTKSTITTTVTANTAAATSTNSSKIPVINQHHGHYHHGVTGRNCHSKFSSIAAGSYKADTTSILSLASNGLQQEVKNATDNTSLSSSSSTISNNKCIDDKTVLLAATASTSVANPLPPSSLSSSSNNNSSISSTDTKKARKVQNKGSRCHNTNSKRNK